VRHDIGGMNLGNARLALPLEEVEHALKSGKVQFPWKQLCLWFEAPAAASPSPAAGDLLVELAYRPHRLFRRIHEHDLWFYLPIAPWEAVLGAVLEIPTLEKPFRVHVPAGSTSGQTFRLKGRGLPRPDGARGDLLACLRIVTPDVPTEIERQLYLQLSRSSRFNPRRGFG